jgi:diguanylate cyclase (GGDEF)-like protein
MKFDRKFFHSKVARRIFMLFILCALLPSVTLAIVSYSLVVKQLTTQTQERLHQASKETAMSLLERLEFLDGQMKEIASKVRSGAGPSSDGLNQVLGRYFKSVMIVKDKDRQAVHFGSIQNPPPAPNLQERKHLNAGMTLISIRKKDGLPLPLFMSRILEPHHPEKGILVAEINPTFLWGNSEEGPVQPAVEVFLSDQSSMVPISSLPGKTLLPEQTASLLAQSSSGQFEWLNNGKEYISSYWSIFLKNNFFMPKWTVLVSESKSDVLTPLIHFKKTFLLVFLMSLWAVLLLSISQIRRNLGPIEKLQEAIRRIAEGEFDVPVTIESGDEFEDLANSFNGMAGRLGKQFGALAGAAKIDRAILSTLDTKQIVEAVLTGMREIIFCDWVMMTLLDSKTPDSTRTYFRSSDGASGEMDTAVRLSPEDAARLRQGSVNIVKATDPHLPAFLSPLVQRGIKSFLILPVYLKDKLAAIITVGQSARHKYNPDDLLHICRLVDQVAVALSNARMVEQIHVLAYYDGLTGLPNREMFKEQLNRLLPLAKRRDKMVAILFLDLDNFKRINDTLGHDLGDKLLREVTNRLIQWIRPSDYPSRANAENTIVSRLGGDEFTIYLSDIDRVQDAATVAQRILDVLSKPFMLDTHEVFITASVGITVFPSDGHDVDTLLKNADTAMYHAKDQGRNNYQFFTPSMNAEVMKRLSLETDLRKALERQEFLLHYQPKVDLRTGKILGVEALIRWLHPDRGLVPPGEFIPLSEQTGLVVPIGQWALNAACAQNKALQAAGFPPMGMSANLSGRQILDPQLPEIVARILKGTGLDPKYLEVELTESILIQNQKSVIDTLHALREMGIQLSLDDFGTGYSSLSYLNRFPVDTLKIDKSFVDNIPTNQDSVALIRAIIAMAHSLKLKVLAEGVETEGQLVFLREEGCDEVQGNLFSPAVPVEALEKLLREGKRLPDEKPSNR